MHTPSEIFALAQETLALVKAKVLSSQDILPKDIFPFHDPRHEPLYHLAFGKKFKQVQKQQQLLSKAREFFHPLAKKHLRHSFISSACIAISEFGVGECQEASTLAYWYLLQRGYKNVSIIGIESPPNPLERNNRQNVHCFLLLNCPKDPVKLGELTHLNDLPPHYLILDPFLNTITQAKNFLEEQKKYITVLNFQTIVAVQDLHAVRTDIIREIKTNVSILLEQAAILGFHPKFNPSTLKPCHETMLIKALNDHSGLRFDWGHQDYLIDAYAPLHNDEDIKKAKTIQQTLGHGKIRYLHDQGFFVLRHLNKGQTAKDIEGAYGKPRV